MSRNSDFGGYWLFGFLVEDIEDMQIDLIEDISGRNETSPMSTAKLLAVTKFAEQIEKAGLLKSCIREAYLDITKSPGFIDGYVNDWLTRGYSVTFVAKAVTDFGKPYESTLSTFIAPHNPKVEQRSARV
jgi:hypothetical protein